MYRRSLSVCALALVIAAPTATLAADSHADPSTRFQKAPSAGSVGTLARPLSVGADGRVTVIVEMQGDPVAVVEARKGRDLTATERDTVKNTLKKAQDAIAGSIRSKGGRIQANMQSAYNGIQVSIPASQVNAVAALPNVVAVHAVRTYSIDNSVSVPFLGVPQVWQDTGYTGRHIKVGIIDTGIDFTHANFGGPGTPEAYTQANADEAQPADPALFGPNAPRVKGGYDFVGDAYDGDNTPVPDANPLDCQGHGSHVAGTAAGDGVKSDGSTYTGPYNASTTSKSFRIGPGVAPQADLYAIRVFGCEGSTSVVVPAIDWAVDHGMDVINMSLGSTYGFENDPDAVAASNAIGAGVVVVTSAGNEGPSPYVVGSPSVGDGVISVAAVDSTATFPGARVTIGSQVIDAINANGANLAGLPALTIVRLSDDPATTAEDESLGCSVAAYEHAGVTSGSGQLAVSTRGFCARVAKAIYAQQAGAAAALMVNTSADYPPFEGEITSNPDTGEAYTVTIPFLGVSSTASAAFVTGQSATLVSAILQNPGFRGYASFSSSGPRSGDSAVGPDLAAPGVSIVSTGVGTGNEAETISGTSMAAPHVAGAAALAVQAHPAWKPAEIAAALVSTADPASVAGQQLSRGGVGLVDIAQAVTTKVTATGDAFRTDDGWLRESALSFGFQESSQGFGGVKTITIENHGSRAVTYRVSSAPTDQSAAAKVTLNRTSVTVPAGGKATVVVTLKAATSAVGTSIAGVDQFSFYKISGDIVLTSGSSTLRVPYLLVPRSNSRVAATSGDLFPRKDSVKDGQKSVKLSNPLGALAADADFYTWGLKDAKDVPTTITDSGFDLRAAGVQSFDYGDDQLVVFAVNTHKRWSNAASNEFDVVIDTNGDSAPDWIVFSADSGLVRTGDPTGVSEVFLYDLATGSLGASGFLAVAPTDSSTLLLPVWASDLGVTDATGAFSYGVDSYSIVNTDPTRSTVSQATTHGHPRSATASTSRCRATAPSPSRSMSMLPHTRPRSRLA